ncbi:MAG: Uma2 family endonuclease, partial [Tychonema bourrellyi B0820]|nr:Uma2 family endonuclease [Tychonema bourrellyi B0820]
GEYQPLPENSSGHLWSQQLNLFLGIHQKKLRFFTASGELVPTPEESADFERQQKEFAQQRADRLAAKLRELNIDPDTI